MTWRLPAAITFSGLAHLVLIWAWRMPIPAQEEVSAIAFEMLAAVPVEPEHKSEPVPEAEPEPQPEPQATPEPSEPPSAPTDPSPTVPRDDRDSPEQPPRTVLNLAPPPIWDALVDPDQPSAPRAGLEFNPALSEAVSSRIRARSRAGLLAARYRAVEGLSAEEYGRTGASGDVVKVDGQCFSLQETPELGSEPRWWMVKCLDVKTDPFKMAPLETDARGRAIAD